jgi:chromosome partitioning protein
MPAKRVAMINMKGGVGKSTLTVNLAYELSGVAGRDNNVLVVDLDPQFNASQYMLGTARYKRDVVATDRPTVWDVFEQRTRTPTKVKPVSPKPAEAIVTVRSWSTNKLDLVPSRLELAWSLKQPGGKEGLLKDFLDQVEDEYDLILIDCAPTESVLTSAAYYAADQIVVPVKPEFLSTIGLPLLATSMKDHNSTRGTPKVSVSGIIFNHTSNYHPEERLAKREVRQVAANFGWTILGSEVPYSRSFPKGAREGKPLRRTSYARKAQKSKFKAVAAEFATVVGV